MTVFTSQTREIYPQKDFIFNFAVSNYSSRNFQVGVSGQSDYIFFDFKSGLIHDSFGNFIGTYKGEAVSIDCEVQNNKLNYSLNSKEVVRGVTTAGSFSKITAKVFDDGNFNLESYVFGNNRPTISFWNLLSEDDKTYGALTIDGESNLHIFSMTSPSVPGDWYFPSVVAPSGTYGFGNYGISGLSIGTQITLNLNTSFGPADYTIKVQDPNNPGDSTLDPLEPIEFAENAYSEIWKVSGELNDNNQWTGLYRIDYSVGLGENGNEVNVDFEYFAGKSGNTLILKDIETSLTYSGTIFGSSGIGEGYLYNNKPKITEWHQADDYNEKYIDFYPVQDNKFFSNVKMTGDLVWEINVEGFYKNLNDADIKEVGNYVDMGGYKEAIPAPSNGDFKKYTKLYQYKDILVHEGDYILRFTGNVTEADNGVLHVDKVNKDFSFPIFHTDELLYSSDDIIDTNTSITIHPYRGPAFRGLEPTEYCWLNGPENGSLGKSYVLLSADYDTLIFKNLPTIASDGFYEIPAGEQISGRILNKDRLYKRESSDFIINTDLIKGLDLPNEIVRDAVESYRGLNPFSVLENLSESLLEEQSNGQLVKFEEDFNWEGNNFVAVNEKGGSVGFYSNSDPLYCLAFDDPTLLWDPFVNDLSRKNSNKNNLLMERKTFGLNQKFFIKNNVDVGAPKYFWYSKNGDLTTRIYYNEVTTQADIEEQNIQILIPLDLESYTFSVYVRKPNTNGVRYVQLSFEDGIGPQAGYVNIDLQGPTMGTNPDGTGSWETIAGGNFVFTYPVDPAPPDSGDWIRIAYTINPKVKRKLSHMKLSFVNSLSSAKGEKYTGGAGNSLYVGGFQLEPGMTSLFPSSYEYVDNNIIVTTYAGEETMFAYFINKIYGIKGRIARFGNTIFPSFVPDKSNGQYYTTYGTKLMRQYWIYKYKGDSTFSEGTMAYKLKKFFLDKIYPTDTEKLNFYASTRHDKTFFSLATDFESLFVKELDGSITEFTQDDVDYGDAVTEIIQVIKDHSPEVSTIEYFRRLQEDGTIDIVKIPEQLNEITLIEEDLELSNIMFSGTLNKPVKLFIPIGFGRYYPPPTTKTYGFYWETPKFNSIENESFDQGQYLDVFPDRKEALNTEAFITKSTQLMKDQDSSLNRLVIFEGDYNFEKDINQDFFMTSAEMTIEETETVQHSGLFENFQQMSFNIWNGVFSDDEEGEVDPVNLINPIEDKETNTIADFGLKNNELYTKYLRVVHNKPDYTIEGEEDEAKITVYVTQGGERLYESSLHIP